MLWSQDPSVYNGNIGHYEDCCCLESDAFSLVLNGVTCYKTMILITYLNYLAAEKTFASLLNLPSCVSLF